MTHQAHSLKPFLLDALLSWSAANHTTPLLIVMRNPLHILPDGLPQEKKMLFNLSARSISGRMISTQGICFDTHLWDEPQKSQKVFLALEGWVGLKIKETGQIFSLSFTEILEKPFDVWPEGIVLSYPKDQSDRKSAQSDNTGDEENSAFQRPRLRLVVNNEKQ